MKAYEKLAFFYQKDWGKFSIEYIKLLKHIFDKNKFQPKTILDIACGTGDLLGELHKEGFEVVGSDLSPEMIKVAKTKNPTIEFYINDMSKIDLQKSFDVIICPFDSINYLLEDEMLDDTFKKVYKHLTDKGFFVFDANTKNLYEAKHHGIIDREVEGIEFKQILKYDSENQIAYTTFKFNESEEETHVQKAYSKEIMGKKLISHGFKVIETYENLDFVPASEKSERVYYVAQKL
jgi:SAM-dependent methyltransferase